MQLKDRKRRQVVINITSLIDVCFLLLIFLMVSSTFVEQPGMKLELPEAKTATTERISELVLEVKADGTMFVNQEPIALAILGEKLKQMLPQLEEKTLILKADKLVPHGTIVEIMDQAKLNGVEKLVIATQVGKK